MQLKNDLIKTFIQDEYVSSFSFSERDKRSKFSNSKRAAVQSGYERLSRTMKIVIAFTNDIGYNSKGLWQ
ncbi:MAG: hypothetical protein M1426_01325 [Patescibacteria group bacterium]|nr:hypothetical protein [Patescibacteria group bacterium]